MKIETKSDLNKQRFKVFNFYVFYPSNFKMINLYLGSFINVYNNVF